jgi:hypothetical protein
MILSILAIFAKMDKIGLLQKLPTLVPARLILTFLRKKDEILQLSIACGVSSYQQPYSGWSIHLSMHSN